MKVKSKKRGDKRRHLIQLRMIDCTLRFVVQILEKGLYLPVFYVDERVCGRISTDTGRIVKGDMFSGSVDYLHTDYSHHHQQAA